MDKITCANVVEVCHCSAVSVVTTLQCWMIRGLNHGTGKIFLTFFKTSRPVLGPTHPPVQIIRQLFSGGKATDQLHLVLKLRMSGSIRLLPPHGVYKNNFSYCLLH
jgi:hypothetical protein